MAFAAARMIMPKEKVVRKPSTEFNQATGKKSTLRPSRSPSLVSSTRSGLSADSLKNKPPGIPRSASGRPLGKPPISRGHVKHFKKKGKKGGKADLQYDLIVNIDLDEWQITDEQVAEYKEVFMLFDKDEDGVLTFQELNVVMKSLGQRPSEKELLQMVREVSEDRIYDTIEFNEFLQMMSKQQRNYTQESLKDAFRIFDKDDDGLISVEELRHIMLSLGEKMTEKELDEMITEANCDQDGHIDYEEFVLVLCNDGKKSGARRKNRKNKKRATSAISTTPSVAVNSTTAKAAVALATTSRPLLTSSTSCNGNLMMAEASSSKSSMTMASVHATANPDNKNNNQRRSNKLEPPPPPSTKASPTAAAHNEIKIVLK